MSLVSGPGRGGGITTDMLDERILSIENHVKYIQRLDTVSLGNAVASRRMDRSCARSGKTSWSIGGRSIFV